MNVDRKLKELAKELKENGDSEALKRLEEISKLYEGEDKIVSWPEIRTELRKKPPEEKIFTGFKLLDKTLDGFRPKQLITLTGITKHGKTTFAMELAQRLKNYAPLILPFEEPAEELIMKFEERGMDIPLCYSPLTSRNRSLDWIEDKIIEAKAKYGTKIVFIDHLDYINEVMQPNGENETTRVKHTMQHLKDMAKQWEVVIVLLTHLKKVQLDRNPDLEDIRGSAAISQESDTVMIMWRKTERVNGEIEIYNDATLSIQANRRTGKTANIHLTFEGGRFMESEEAELEATAKLQNRNNVDDIWNEL